MKIALAQQNYHIGNFEKNVEKIIDGINWAKKQGADLVVFSELCVCGYFPKDFLEFTYFSLAPFGTSSEKVAITGLSFSPTEAASNMPCDS